MATIKGLVESDKLSNPNLVTGVLETIIERGARDVAAVLPAKAYEGTQYDFNIEDTIPSDVSNVDPYSTADLPEGTGDSNREVVPIRSLARNADTPVVDVVGKSDINDQRAEDVQRAAKAVGRDWIDGFFSGTGVGTNLFGLDYWIDRYDNTHGFSDQDFDAAGATISLDLLQDLITRQKDGEFEVLYASRSVYNAVRGILNDMPGNTAEMVMDEMFGRRVLAYDNVRIVMADAPEKDKVIPAANWTLAGTTITYTGDGTDGFKGFSDSDLGKDVTDSGTGSGSTIDTVTSSTVADLSAAGTYADTETLTIDGDSLPLLYAVRFDTDDGMAHVYHRGLAQTFGATMGAHYGSLAGFSARDLGELQGPNILRVRLDMFANFALHSPYAAARMRNFALS